MISTWSSHGLLLFSLAIYWLLESEHSTYSRVSTTGTTSVASQTELTEATKELEEFIGKRYPDYDRLLEESNEQLGAVKRELLAVESLRSLAAKSKTTSLEPAMDAEDLLERLGAAKEKRIALSDKKASLERDIRKLELDDIVSKTQQMLSVARTLGLRDGHCPVCDIEQTQQQFEKGLLKNEERLAHVAVQFKSLASELDKTERQLREAISLEDNLVANKDAAEKSVAEYRLLHESAIAEIDKLSENSRKAIGSRSDGELPTRDSLKSLQNALWSTQVRIERLVRVVESQNFNAAVHDLRVNVNRQRDQIKNLQAQRKRCTLKLERADRLRSGIQSSLTDLVSEQIAAVEPVLQEFYRRLTPHPNWDTARLRLEGGNIERFLKILVGNESFHTNPALTLSAGQKRVAGLSLLLAMYMSKTFREFGCLLLDDPVQHIDSYRALHVVETLAALRKEGAQVICSAEDERLARLMCRRLALPGSDGKLLRFTYGKRFEPKVDSERQSPLIETVLLKAS